MYQLLAVNSVLLWVLVSLRLWLGSFVPRTLSMVTGEAVDDDDEELTTSKEED